MTKAIVIHMSEGGDLYQKSFDDIEEAREFLDEILEWKAFLITGNNLTAFDRT